jgi:hypothetical protein
MYLNATLNISGTGNYIEANGSNMAATMSNGSVAIDGGGSLTLTGTNDVISINQGASLTVVGSGAGDHVDVINTGAIATVSDAAIVVHSSTSLTLTGTNDTVDLLMNASLTASSATHNITIKGTGDSVNVAGGGTITMNPYTQATIANNQNTINMGVGSLVTVTGNNDTFVFAPSFGHETITGYVASGAGADTINIDHTEFADWAHLLAGSTQSGSDVLITANANDSILLKNTTLASLQQSQFHFT